eukprot:COSAG04_NODE_2988_length_3309_cov_1.989720_4_plen_133_part_00
MHANGESTRVLPARLAALERRRVGVAAQVAGVAGARARQAGGVPGRDGAAGCRSRCRSRCGAARGGVRAEGGEKREEVVDVDAAVAVDVLAVGAGGAELAKQLQKIVDVDLRVDNDNSARVRSRRASPEPGP